MKVSQALQKDVVVVGGGMVGAAAAIGLAKLGLSVAVVDAYRPQAYEQEQALDIRVSAISVASERLLEQLGAMPYLAKMRKAPYRGLETWELDGCITQFHADQVGSAHLGHIVENRLIQLALWRCFEHDLDIELFCPSKVDTITALPDGVLLTLDDQRKLQAKLLVGADGANSQVRQWANIGLTGWDYGQSAMLINIATEVEQQDVTWQQFTPNGPRSLLPLPGKHASLVWYDDAARIAQLANLSNSSLAQQITQHFPDRLDKQFTVIDKASFKLTRRHAQSYCAENLVLVGDAAHTINPLAGQGVNLGFKDVAALITMVEQAIKVGEPWWALSQLKQYQQSRYFDNQLMMSTMDLFYASFSNDLTPLKLLRNSALKLANIDGPIKRKVLKYAMGLG
ncbi:FAD-dependent oxidoreductase [Shewanella waksmanii]|uniref:FAD-dependent oxidoreductase n=1 Tax=Shewanella waksmanii TaxID=213783 RepID=UPI003735B64C